MTPDVVDAILEEAGKLAAKYCSAHAVGDAQGCEWKDGEVKTPAGFKQAYRHYVEGGWSAVGADPEYGG